LMEVDVFMLTYREIIERYFRRYK
jgi:hypothetical protein